MIRNVLLLFIPPLITITTFAREPLFPNELYFNRYPLKVLIKDVNEDGYPDAIYSVFVGRTHIPFGTSPNNKVEAMINDGEGGVEEFINLDGSNTWIDILINEQEPKLPPTIRVNEDSVPGIIEFGGIVDSVFQPKGLLSGPVFEFVALIDWDLDGIDDLLVLQEFYGVIGFSIIPGKPDGKFETGFIEQNERPFLPPDRDWSEENYYERPADSKAYGDINEDGIIDEISISIIGMIPVGEEFITIIHVKLGNSDGSFTEIYTFDGTFQDDLILADFNRDCHLDLLQLPLTSSSGIMNIGNGDSMFQEQYSVNLGMGSTPQLGDFNGDGYIDLLNWNTGTDTVVPDAFSITVGNGDGTFQSPRFFSVITPFINYGVSHIVVNANHDGNDDLWFEGFNLESSFTGVWLNQHQGTSNIKSYELYE